MRFHEWSIDSYKTSCFQVLMRAADRKLSSCLKTTILWQRTVDLCFFMKINSGIMTSHEPPHFSPAVDEVPPPQRRQRTITESMITCSAREHASTNHPKISCSPTEDLLTLEKKSLRTKGLKSIPSLSTSSSHGVSSCLY
ncbi:hypothetical protein OIU76_006026 [Salix suchowensis]|nr:hypothetical protein OIU76_006026 [Salix suchowensis]